MEKSDILKQLKKEKYPLKYLQELLKKIKDKKLQKEIENLIKEYTPKKPKKKTPSTLESTVLNTPTRLPKVTTETLETYQPPSRRRVLTTGTSISNEDKKPQEDYGSSVKKDYITTKSQFKESLESKGLISKTGFSTTAESKEAARQQSQDYDLNQEENIKYHDTREEHMKEDLTGLASDLKETHKKKKERFYHG
tara:strand:- start:206 stop:790 length:585 start_codon:yes stop_codon:yes gene_type:complete